MKIGKSKLPKSAKKRVFVFWLTNKKGQVIFNNFTYYFSRKLCQVIALLIHDYYPDSRIYYTSVKFIDLPERYHPFEFTKDLNESLIKLDDDIKSKLDIPF